MLRKLFLETLLDATPWYAVLLESFEELPVGSESLDRLSLVGANLLLLLLYSGLAAARGS
jgi:hypothetical protein